MDAGESRRRCSWSLVGAVSCGDGASDHFIPGVCGLFCQVAGAARCESGV
jgi:hypothetical protein